MKFIDIGASQGHAGPHTCVELARARDEAIALDHLCGGLPAVWLPVVHKPCWRKKDWTGRRQLAERS